MSKEENRKRIANISPRKVNSLRERWRFISANAGAGPRSGLLNKPKSPPGCTLTRAKQRAQRQAAAPLALAPGAPPAAGPDVSSAGAREPRVRLLTPETTAPGLGSSQVRAKPARSCWQPEQTRVQEPTRNRRAPRQLLLREPSWGPGRHRPLSGASPKHLMTTSAPEASTLALVILGNRLCTKQDRLGWKGLPLGPVPHTAERREESLDGGWDWSWTRT